MTLSSTHLPFLLEFFQRLYPQVQFLDPAVKTAEEVKTFLATSRQLNQGNQPALTVITTTDAAKTLNAAGLKKILAILGLETAVSEVMVR